ncbi:MAG TPA: zinc ribbon domain-containing protein [Dehalococcoidia bacterium]|jgi:putative FmdB family regulatory protein|nr:zinc ribbon domain-containing protein [Dehalococcoidia bacterium]
MPIYEYRCLACKKRTSVFVRSVSSPVSAACEHCGGKKLTRLISRVAVHRGGGDFDDASGMDGVDENDPRAVARWARQMRDEMGEDMGPEFDEMVGRMEAGEMPDDVGGDDDAFGGGDDDF